MRGEIWLKTDVTTSQDLSDDALDYTTEYTRVFKLEQIMIRIDASITETVTLTLDSAKGSDYDVELVSQKLVGKTSFRYKPSGEDNFQAGDNIRIQCSNDNLTGEAFVIVKTSEM